MHFDRRIKFRLLRSVALPAVLFAGMAAAQNRPAAPAQPAFPSQRAEAQVSDRDFAATQAELIKLLRLSPTLTTVVEHDPSLLANQEYVSHNNPQLAQFIAAHPEIARNPDFYLFTHVHRDDGSPDEALERAVWPEFNQPRRYDPMDSVERILEPFMALLAFACFLGALIWIIRQILENRRWNKMFKLQSDVHGRLIDKFSTSQELSAYMGTEAGKRFLEAAPISAGMAPEQRMPNAIARVLTPLQIGIVLVLLGTGLIMLRHASADTELPMLIFGTVALMPGLGFIISAAVTWVLAGRLGLLPDSKPIVLSPYEPRDNQ
ncbi:MAG: hypothetical protein ABR923_11165 [Terracidiphilus sp.]|jgi:hypothetical protein